MCDVLGMDLGRVGSQSSGVHGKPATISLHRQVLRLPCISSTAESDPEPASRGGHLDIVDFTGYVLGRPTRWALIRIMDTGVGEALDLHG